MAVEIIYANVNFNPTYIHIMVNAKMKIGTTKRMLLQLAH